MYTCEKCPHCGEVLSATYSDGMGSSEAINEFLNCWNCGYEAQTDLVAKMYEHIEALREDKIDE